MKHLKTQTNKSDIASDNYQQAFNYLDELFFREMTPEMQKTWDQNNGLGALINFYSELIHKLPYHNTKKIKKLKLNHSEKISLTYENREKLFWQIEFNLYKDQEILIRSNTISKGDRTLSSSEGQDVRELGGDRTSSSCEGKDSRRQEKVSLKGGKMKSSEIIQACPVQIGGEYLPQITSSFGTPTYNDEMGFHHGVDMVVSRKDKHLASPVVCSFERAVVVFAGHYGIAGKTIIILDMNSTRLQRIVACYCHLDEIYKQEGDVVVKKEQIGYMGGTGEISNQYGPHLHFSINIIEKDIPVIKGISGYGARNPFDFGLQNTQFAPSSEEIDGDRKSSSHEGCIDNVIPREKEIKHGI